MCLTFLPLCCHIVLIILLIKFKLLRFSNQMRLISEIIIILILNSIFSSLSQDILRPVFFLLLPPFLKIPRAPSSPRPSDSPLTKTIGPTLYAKRPRTREEIESGKEWVMRILKQLPKNPSSSFIFEYASFVPINVAFTLLLHRSASLHLSH